MAGYAVEVDFVIIGMAQSRPEVAMQHFEETLRELERKNAKRAEDIATYEESIRDVQAEIRQLEEEQKETAIVIGFLRRQLNLPEKSAVVSVAPVAHEQRFSRLTTVAAAERWLREVGPPRRDTKTLLNGIIGGGFTTDAKQPYTSVFGTLSRNLAREDGALDKHRGAWGLKEWNLPKEELDTEA